MFRLEVVFFSLSILPLRVLCVLRGERWNYK
jgi:hypothetical protein